MFEYENGIIGLLIGYYRKQKNKEDHFYSKQNFINYKTDKIYELCLTCDKVCAKRESICSYKSYAKIEKGKSVKNICYYIDLCEKLGLIYKLNQQIIEEFEFIERKMLYLIKSYEKEELIRFKTFLEKLSIEYENVIYFGEMLQLYLQILSYLLTRHTPQISCKDFYLENIDRFNDNTKFFIYYLLDKYHYYYGNEIKYTEELFQLMPNILEISLQDKLRTMETNQFYDYLKSYDLNLCSLYDKYLISIYISDCGYHLNDFEFALNVINQSIDDMKKDANLLPETLFYTALLKKSSLLFAIHHYSECLKIYKDVFEYNYNLLSMDFMFFIRSMRLTGQIDSIHKYVNYETFHKIINPRLKVIYRYYLLMYCSNCSIKDLQAYILNYLLPLAKTDKIILSYLKEDMFLFCRSIHNHDKLKLLENIIAK